MTAQKHGFAHVAFLRVGSGGLVESVIDRLTEAVRIGFLNAGQQLPPEPALAEQLDVSTVTLREALAVLRSRGLIETRRGRHGGSFVCAQTATPAAVLRSRLASHAIADLRDLGDECLAVFRTAAELAAHRADESGFVRMRRLIGQLADESTLDGRARALSRFHVEVALSSQSERLTRSELRLQSEIGDIFWTPVGNAEIPDVDVDVVARQCTAIIEALEDEDADRARDAAEIRVRATVDRTIAAALVLQS